MTPSAGPQRAALGGALGGAFGREATPDRGAAIGVAGDAGQAIEQLGGRAHHDDL